MNVKQFVLKLYETLAALSSLSLVLLGGRNFLVEKDIKKRARERENKTSLAERISVIEIMSLNGLFFTLTVNPCLVVCRQWVHLAIIFNHLMYAWRERESRAPLFDKLPLFSLGPAGALNKMPFC